MGDRQQEEKGRIQPLAVGHGRNQVDRGYQHQTDQGCTAAGNDHDPAAGFVRKLSPEGRRDQAGQSVGNHEQTQHHQGARWFPDGPA